MFTDEQIEDWLDEKFEGDKEAIEKYLKETEEGRSRLKIITSFYQALKEQPLPELSFSLSDAVVNQLGKRVVEEPKKGIQFFPVMLLILTGVVITGFLFVKNFSFFNGINILTGGIIGLLVILFVSMNIIDWLEQRKRYERMMLS
jgi:hypothetical protein